MTRLWWPITSALPLLILLVLTLTQASDVQHDLDGHFQNTVGLVRLAYYQLGQTVEAAVRTHVGDRAWIESQQTSVSTMLGDMHQVCSNSMIHNRLLMIPVCTRV